MLVTVPKSNDNVINYMRSPALALGASVDCERDEHPLSAQRDKQNV
jgi:hypothetical protein